MLHVLSKLPYMVMWSDDERTGKNVGWTEFPIWINNNGIGYYGCDEPEQFYKALKIPDDKWNSIISKLQHNDLQFEDIYETSLIAIIDYQEVCDKYELNYYLSDILNFPDVRNDYYYVTLDDSG